MIDGTENFTPEYRDAMLKAEKAKCETCGKSMLAHAATFVREACERVSSASEVQPANAADQSDTIGALRGGRGGAQP